MALFGKRKEKEETTGCCCGSCDCESMEQAEKAKSEGARVKVLGSGCAKCNALEAATKAALEQLGMDTTIEHVTDFAKIASYGSFGMFLLVLVLCVLAGMISERLSEKILKMEEPERPIFLHN